jgi:hypothetical protein
MVAKAVAIVITPTAKCLKCAEMTRAMKRFGYSVGAKIEPKRQGRNRRYDCALGDRPSVIWVIGGRAAGCFHNALRARSFRQVAPVSAPQPMPVTWNAWSTTSGQSRAIAVFGPLLTRV